MIDGATTSRIDEGGMLRQAREVFAAQQAISRRNIGQVVGDNGATSEGILERRTFFHAERCGIFLIQEGIENKDAQMKRLE
jgi:hypothetical protein